MSPIEAETSGVTERLCQWIHHTTFESIPDPIKDRSKHLILDGIACGLVGAHVPWSEEAFNAINQFEARGQHAIIGYNEVTNTLQFLFKLSILLLLLLLTLSMQIISDSVLLPLPSLTVPLSKHAS